MSDSGMNDRVMPENQPEAVQIPVSPGAQLAAHRQERGWTVEQVASQLNLASRQIVAIESDDYAALPGVPIVRGFIRQYAKLLKVDAAPLLKGMGESGVPKHEPIAPRQTLATPFSEARLPSMTGRPAWQFKWLVVLLLAALLGAAIWALQQGGSGLGGFSREAASQVKDLTQMPGAGAPQQQAQAPKAEAPVVEEPKAESPNSTDAAGTAKDATPASAPVVAAAPSVPVAPVVAQAPSKPETQSPQPAAPPASGKDTLVLKVREDSWVEIKRTGNNSALVSRIMKAGETESVEVTEPVAVVIGNAAGVDASLRGAPLELKAGVNNNVARLTLK